MAKTDNSLWNPVPIAESRLAETPIVSPRYKGRLFHGSWRDPVHIHGNQYIYGAMWDVEHSLPVASLNIYKTMQINGRRKVWKKITGLKLKIKSKIEVNQSQNQEGP